jgi:FG-GAP-like repeat
MQNSPSQSIPGSVGVIDRLTDVLWRNPLDNTYSRRSLSGSTLLSKTPQANLQGNWKVVATGDQNNDDQSDLLWRNSDDGRLRWQIFDGNGNLLAPVDLYPVSDFNWSIGGTADFDRDGQLDLLWYNRTSGVVGWWLMNGAQIREVAMLQSVGNPTTWNAVGTADANGDGQIDILWRNDSTQSTGWWLMNGKAIQSVAYLVPNEPDSNQQVKGIADFNRDGTLDVLWQNKVNGATNLWLMDAVKADGTQVVRLENYAIDRAAGAEIVGVTFGQLQIEADVAGDLNGAQSQAGAIFFHRQSLGAADTSDAYRFTVGSSGIFTAQLTGLSADADMELISDRNRNGQVDAGEVLAFPWERGTTRESMRRFLAAGDYFLRVKSVGNASGNYALATNFTAAASDPLRFDLQVNFGSGLEGLTAPARQAILDAAQYWEDVILYRSEITTTNRLAIDLKGSNLNLADNNPDTITFAFAQPKLVLEGGKVKITSGSSTINTRRLAELNANPTYLKGVMIHEFAHVLGFGGMWQPVDYTASNGVVSKVGNNFVDLTTATYQANSYAGWVYGGLVGQATAAAIPLDRLSLSHWDEGVFDTEMMTPISELLGVVTPVSALSLAALRDLGWQVNMGAAEAYVLPRDRAASPAIDRSQLSYGNASASVGAKLTGHSPNCGCRQHLRVDRPDKLGLRSLGPTSLGQALGLA